MASLQAQAQQGNPQAIATLLQTTFPVQPIEIRANREGQGLMLSLSALDPLDQTATVQFIQASLNKLNPEGISALHVQAYTHGQAATSWEATIRLSAYTSANSQTPPQPTTSANSPAPDDTPTLSFTAGRTETSATHSPELEQQAILGNTEAIETILNQVFAQQPMLEQLAAQHPLQVSAYHEGQCLYLLLEAETAPEPEPCLIQIDRIISQWRSPRLQRLDVAGQAFSAAQPAWVQEFKVGTYTAQHPQAETTIVIPAPATNLPSRPPANARSTTQFSRQAYTSTQPEPATELDYTAAPSDLRPYYELLQLSPDASVDQLNQAYFNLRVEQRRQGNQEAIAQLKEAYHILKRQIQEQTYEGTRAASGITSSSLEADAAFTATGVPNSVPSAAQVSQSDEPEAPTSDAIAATTRLSHFLKVQELDARLSIRGDELHIGLLTKQHPKPTKPVARIFTLLESLNLAGMGLTKIRTVHVYGLSGPKQVVWQQQFAMPGRALNDAELDLLSFKNRHSTTIIFPALMAIAIFLNLWSIPRLLLQGIKIWFHEFGHAIVAWLAGHRAIPLPVGWTNTGEQRSLFVYFGILTLLGLLFWLGRREQKRWAMVLAASLIVLQFYMTWLMPDRTYEILLSFGGIGGEFYICAALMIGFFFPLPHYFRWDFYRYPAVLGAAFTFWGNVWFWHQIDRGQQAIPWGTLWGGSNDAGGDMNILVAYGWTNQEIINRYNALSDICLVALLSVYLYFLIRDNRHVLFALKQRLIMRQS